MFVFFQEKNLGKSSLRVSVWDIQIDNQEHQKGGYDFSVVLLGHGCNADGTYPKNDIESNDINSLASSYRDGCPAIDITLGIDVTNRPGLLFIIGISKKKLFVCIICNINYYFSYHISLFSFQFLFYLLM